MLLHLFKSCNRILIFRNFSTTSRPLQKWDLLTAICIERKPVITPALTDLQKAYQKYLEDIEHEKSYKSDFEIRMEKDLKQAELLKQGTDVDVVVKQTAQDFLDTSTEELNKFKFADRITKADKENDQKSLNRKLDKHLVLVVKQKLGDEDYYILPQAARNEGETLRQTADRLVMEICGSDLKAQIYGNAPTGFYKYKYPRNIQERGGSVGAKVFIYFARYRQGDLIKKGLDFKWLDRMELQRELHHSYHNSVSQFLIDEE
ncbi:putative ribosomal protein L46 [Trypoxylus dichotomus]